MNGRYRRLARARRAQRNKLEEARADIRRFIRLAMADGTMPRLSVAERSHVWLQVNQVLRLIGIDGSALFDEFERAFRAVERKLGFDEDKRWRAGAARLRDLERGNRWP